METVTRHVDPDRGPAEERSVVEELVAEGALDEVFAKIDSPHGDEYLRDHTGTQAVEPDPHPPRRD